MSFHGGFPGGFTCGFQSLEREQERRERTRRERQNKEMLLGYPQARARFEEWRKQALERLEREREQAETERLWAWREYEKERSKRASEAEARPAPPAPPKKQCEEPEEEPSVGQILRELGRDPKPARQTRWEEYEPFELAVDPEIRSQLGLDWPALPDEEEWLSGFGHRGRGNHS